MKPKLIILALIAFTAHAFSQSKNTISFVYGTTSNDVNIHGAIGDFGYTGKGGSQFGLNYTHNFNHTFSLQSGIMFSNDNVQLNTLGPQYNGLFYTGNINQTGNIKLITIPVIAKVSFLKYLYVDAGLLADFETNYSSDGTDQANKTATKQTGIGIELGLGANYNFGRWDIFVNPFTQVHAIARFSSGNTSNFNLLDAGFKFGAGYSF